MNHPNRTIPRFAVASLAVIGLLITAQMFGQETLRPVALNDGQMTGLPNDWTHHHVVFSDHGTLSQAAALGKLGEWNRISQDPRFKIQQAKRTLVRREASAPTLDFATLAARFNAQSQLADPAGNMPRRRTRTGGAWSLDMGTAGSPVRKVFETSALHRGKVSPTQFSCTHNRKTS